MKVTGLKTHTFYSQHRKSKPYWLIVRPTTAEGIQGLAEAPLAGHNSMVDALLNDWSNPYPVIDGRLTADARYARFATAVRAARRSA